MFNIYSFMFVLSLMLLGALGHWGHKKLRKEVVGSILDYLFADYPGRSMSVIFVFIGSSAGIAMTELANIADPIFIYEQLTTTHEIPMMCAASIGACLTHGWAFDSGINKGAKNGS